MERAEIQIRYVEHFITVNSSELLEQAVQRRTGCPSLQKVKASMYGALRNLVLFIDLRLFMKYGILVLILQHKITSKIGAMNFQKIGLYLYYIQILAAWISFCFPIFAINAGRNFFLQNAIYCEVCQKQIFHIGFKM